MSDLLIWLAYLAIPVVLMVLVYRRRDVPFPRLFWLFGLFIATCGTTHLLEAVIFYFPVYRLSAVVKVLTAVASLATVIALIPIIPRALALRTPEALEREVAARTAALAAANDALRREVAERERAESELRDQREWLRIVLASVGEAVVATDSHQRITFLNPAAEALTQWQSIEAIGRPLEEVIRTIDEDSREWIESPVAQVVRSDREFGLANHALLIRRDGAERVIERSATPIRSPMGDIRGVVLAIRDSTERRMAERARAYLAAIVNDGYDSIIGKDLNGFITSWNRAAERLFGYTAAEMVGQNIRLLVPVDRSQEEDEILAKLRKGERVEQFDTVRVTRDGRMIQVALTVSPIRDLSGAVVGASKVLRDVTDQRRAEAELRQSAAFQAQAGRMAHLGAWRIRFERPGEIETNTLVWSDEVFRVFGYEPGSVAPTNALFYGLVHPDDRDRVRDTIRHAIDDRQPYEIEHRIIRPDGTERVVYEYAEIEYDAASQPVRIVGAVQDVTERKRAETAIRASEEQFRLLAESIPQLVWIARTDQTNEYFSRRWAEYTGVSSDELLAAGAIHTIHPDDLASSMARWEAVIETGEPYETEFRIRRSDGAYRWHVSRGVPVRDAAGVVVRWFGTCTDIDTQRRAEEESRALARHVQLLLDSTAEGIYGIDREGRCTFINRSGAAMLGYTTEEVSEVHMHQLVHHSRSNGTPYPLRDCPIHQVKDSTVSSQTDDDFFWRKDGRCFPAATSVAPIRDGVVQGAVVTFTDITARKEAEAALYREREFLGAVLEHIAEGVIACDLDGRLTLSNRAARAIHGAGDHPLPADDWFHQFPAFGPDGETLLAHEEHPLIRALGGERVRDVEFVIQTATASRRTVVGSGQPLYDPAGQKLGAVLAIHDMTERRQLEEQFRQSQKMEAIGRLAGGIAHDFNNLLTVIIGYAEIVRSSLGEDDHNHGLVGEILQAGQRAAQLTRQLLAFSRQSVLAPRVLDLNSVVENLERMLRRMIGEDITFVTRLQPGIGNVLADPTQVEQILMNLTVNARDAMPRGGTLIIETTEAILGPDNLAWTTDFRPGPYVRLTVADTGVGMTDEVRARIFEPFFTTKEKGQGTGLGLATVYGAVRQAGGQVLVDTSPGRGSTFRVYFPLVQGPPSGERPAAGSGSGTVRVTRRGGETVLLVEDEPSLRELSRTILQAGGYTVLVAEDGTAAIRLAETHPGPIHLLLTDVVLPGEGGPAVAVQVTERQPGARVLFVSGYTTDEVIRHGLLLDTMNFLQKPFTPGALARKVREVLDGK